ncbi:hypothetical protein MMC25_005725 [Agyrium rufum]|nr:hypothetical protein [Agyrium rufum]
MQILTAPTRAEIDEAHTRGRWLDIGVPSVRNLRSISRKRVLLWFGLAFSSLPLHLLFNSAVFESLAANEYTVYVASHETGSSKANVTYAALGNQSVPTGFNALSESSQNGTLQRLDRRACLQSYGTYFLANRRDVVIVVNDTLDALVVNYGYGQPPSRATSTPYEWMCAGTDHWQKDCNPSYIVPTADTWSINWRELSGARPFDADPNNPVDYCLSQQVEAKCELQFNVSIMIIVIIANFAKFCCMLYTILTHRIPTIVTIGDAISSFLQRPDAATVDRCTLSRAGVVDQDKWMKWTWDTQTYQVVDSQPQNWDGKAYRWFHGASKTRRCIIALISAYVLLGSAIHGVANNGSSTSLPTLWAMGLGSVNPYALLSGGQSNNSDHLGVVGNILLANTAQVIISFLYFSYNSIFTCELLSREWTSYTQERKSLRVTSPTGIQRSTYFLQLPYTYALPLMVFSGLLHWLVSQSIFLAQVNYYNIDGTHDDSSSISNCGFSCIGIIFAIIVGSLLIMGSWANCFRRYPGGIPLATHCSAAISAACHPPKEDVDAAFKRVQYGEVESKNGVRHCTFTSFDVSTPIAGELYA